MFKNDIEITIRRHISNNEYVVHSIIDERCLLQTHKDDIKDILYASFEKMLRQLENELGTLRE